MGLTPLFVRDNRTVILTQKGVNANIVTMTIYTPDIESRFGPKYRIIADAICDDIRDNRLNAGTKLPTHRDLAYRLGVTVGTITRAYAELQRRGIAGGRVGSGTYVLDPQETRRTFRSPLDINREALARNDNRISLANPEDGAIDLAMNRPSPGPEADALAATLNEISQADGLEHLTQYSPAPGMAHHRIAIAKLLEQVGLNADHEDIILTSGAQHAMAACALGLLQAGDTLLTEELTYPGMTSLIAHRGARVRPVAMDDKGVLPDAMDATIRETGARVAYLMPVHQNPTTATMDIDRLHAIAEVVKQHNLIVLEDDVYGFQPQDRLPPLAQLAPDNVVYINGFAKSIAPGLRLGFMKAPKPLFATLTRAAQITGWMIPPLMGEIATRWINTGMAHDIITWHQDEMRARNKMAAEMLDGFTFKAKPECLHLWLELPQTHRPDDTIRELSLRGVVMAGPESFISTQPTVPHALRLCLGSPPTREQLQIALTHVRTVLSSDPIQAQHPSGTMVM